ncbi:MAG: hypothetical protein RLZZ117_1567 [Cyanobacteriota bacterium]
MRSFLRQGFTNFHGRSNPFSPGRHRHRLAPHGLARSRGPARRLARPSLVALLGLGLCGPLAVLAIAPPALAQVESFLLKSGSQVGPTTEVKPKNCVTAKDGTITCDTELVNPAGTTPAQPVYTPFRN